MLITRFNFEVFLSKFVQTYNGFVGWVVVVFEIVEIGIVGSGL